MQDELAKIKNKIKRAYEYIDNVYVNFNADRLFLYKTQWSDDQKSDLSTLGKAPVELNVLKAYTSRLIGEFSKLEPAPDIEPSVDYDNNDGSQIKLLNGHAKHVCNTAKFRKDSIKLLDNMITGGFAVWHLYTDYKDDYSTEQSIFITTLNDPTSVVFDPMSIEATKSDANYAAHFIPMSLDEARQIYQHETFSDLTFSRPIGNSAKFAWSYINESSEKFIVFADFYEKKKVRKKLLKLSDRSHILEDDYKTMLDKWDKISMPPVPVDSRYTFVTKVVRSRIIENRILEVVETDFPSIPFRMASGNWEMIRESVRGNLKPVCNSYFHDAIGAQRLKNFAASTLIASMENIVQHKFIVAKEALPKEQKLLAAWENMQKPSTLVYNSVHENNPDKPIFNAVMPVQPVPCPPEVPQAIQMADQIIQNVLGSYDASLGINDNQLSSLAIIEAATQSNAAAMPFVLGYISALEDIMQLYIDIMPKYYKTAMTIPMMNQKGERYFVKINENGEKTFSYGPGNFKLNIKVSSSFAVQKNKTLNLLKEITQFSPLLQEYLATDGFMYILDNIEFRNVDDFKENFKEWATRMKQKKEIEFQNQQAQMQNNPQMITAQLKQQEMQFNQQKATQDMKLKQQEIENTTQKIKNDYHIDLLNVHAKDKDIAAKVHINHEDNKVDLADISLRNAIAKKMDGVKPKDIVEDRIEEAEEPKKTYKKRNKPKE